MCNFLIEDSIMRNEIKWSIYDFYSKFDISDRRLEPGFTVAFTYIEWGTYLDLCFISESVNSKHVRQIMSEKPKPIVS